MITLDSDINFLPGIPTVYRKKLKNLEINKVRDLLFYFPTRYQDFSKLIEIKNIPANQDVSIRGQILEIKNNFIRRYKITSALISDETGNIKATWFGQTYLSKILKKGDWVILAGKTVQTKSGIHLSNPIYEKIDPQEFDSNHLNLMHTGRIIPIYSQSQKLSSRWIRKIISGILNEISDINEYLPENIIKEHNLLDLKTALSQVHFPDSMEKAKLAQQRFAFDELLVLELLVIKEKIKNSAQDSIAFPIKLEAVQSFVKSLPFPLTDDQKKAVWRILKDMESPSPMSRLLEGDVGSGKTVVAAIACLNVIKNGYQAAFMAPTEILAIQHFKTLSKIFAGFNINVGLLTGKQDKFMSKKLKGQPIEISKKKLIEKTEEGEINILVGTHALIKGKVKFKDLGILIIDEQHRFGVAQRASLIKERKQKKTYVPHLLSMTATPIPRSLALTVYGDLDLTIIKQMPEGRKKIITQIITEEKRQNTYDFIADEIKSGRQAFVICPRIQENKDQKEKKNSSWEDVKSATKVFCHLQEKIFPNLKIALLHGKMPIKEKDKTMQNFKDKKYDILVSTSVVEVGVDVPNATVMMIEGAERFGLAQLHQFRGRVGRSQYQSYCFLFLSDGSSSNERSLALVKSETGFAVAQKDLEIRGPGEIFGTKQSGIPDIVMSALKDIELVEKTRQIAKEILISDQHLKKYPELSKRLNSFKEKVHLE
ncbi:MAG TPA: ATP-dependent DNA helicase RecG [Candidatus Pacearchaeota archaeon]|nr:ATP-dependent DNA helicase RecG [Candidatus Pacearchaeota archaeon]